MTKLFEFFSGVTATRAFSRFSERLNEPRLRRKAQREGFGDTFELMLNDLNLCGYPHASYRAYLTARSLHRNSGK